MPLAAVAVGRAGMAVGAEVVTGLAAGAEARVGPCLRSAGISPMHATLMQLIIGPSADAVLASDACGNAARHCRIGSGRSPNR